MLIRNHSIVQATKSEQKFHKHVVCPRCTMYALRPKVSPERPRKFKYDDTTASDAEDQSISIVS